MSYEFKTPRETKIIIERDERGRERKITATAGHRNSGGHWDITLEHPSGKKWPATITGSNREVIHAMETMLDRTRNDFRNDDAQPRAVSDQVISVDAQGQGFAGYVNPHRR